jgi:dipeptidyl aminopeptidase/acylaminoacyl peptidase
MNVPKGSPPAGGFPLLVLNHGYIDPAIYTNGRGLRREQDYLARRGYVVIHPDYRNHAESDDDPDYELDLRLGYVEDVINAVYAARVSGLPYIDAARVGMLGHSMGGGVALNVLAGQPDLVKAAVLFAPVSSDYRDNFEKWTRGGEMGRVRAARIIEAYGAPEDNPAFWREVSVRNFFGRITAPIMNHHGTEDESVPLAWSQTTHDALLSAGRDSQLFIYEGEPHEFINAWPQVMQRTVEFFDEKVKGVE